MSTITIEQVGTGGTSLGAFTRTKPVAVIERAADSYGYTIGYRVRSLTSREVIGEIRPAFHLYSAWNVDEVHGTSDLAKSNVPFMTAVTAILGRPGYGYDRYRQVSS